MIPVFICVYVCCIVSIYGMETCSAWAQYDNSPAERHTHLHISAERSVGAEEDLALFVSAVVHPGKFGRQTDDVAVTWVGMQQTGTCFRSGRQ